MINFIIEYFYPEIGGLEKSTERLAIELTKKGYKINIITKLLEGTKEKEIYKGITIYRFCDDYILNCSKTSLFKDANINCVFGVGHKKDHNVWKPIFDAKKPTFIKIGTSGDIIDKGIPLEYFKGFKAILCQNDNLVEETEKLNIKGLHGLIIKNGLDIKEWQNNLMNKTECRKLYNLLDDEFVISAVGRFVIRKNFPLIIKSIYRLKKEKKIENITILLHGSDFGQHDGEEKEIKELVKKLNMNVLFIEPNKPVCNTLRASDVFITMGSREGAPNIIIEAMATGLPIIASNISGHDVYVTNNGFLVNFDEADICKHIYLLYSNRQMLKDFGQNSLNNVLEFDISKTSELYLDIFKRWW